MDKTENSLKIDITSSVVPTWTGDALAIGIFEESEAQPALSRCGKNVEAHINKILSEKWIKGTLGESLILPLPAHSGLMVSRLILLGMGKRDSLNEESFRLLGGHLDTLANKSSIRSLHCLITLDTYKGVGKTRALAALAEGAWLGHYRFELYKKEDKNKPQEKQTFKNLSLGVTAEGLEQANKRLKNVKIISQGVSLARTLGNQPGNVLNPESLASHARKLSENLPIKTTIYAEKTLAKKGMNGILAVGGGSTIPPRLITMEYKNGGDRPLLAVVGKAITFDSGGISLKPGARMEEMKFDMCGGAAVFGFMQSIAQMELPINVVGIVPTAENMPSSKAQRPGDIIKTAKGVFVEVINTDAEGRLILADALHHAESFNPATIIDLATLTGACVVALGSKASGIMGNNNSLIKNLIKAGEKSGDRLWQLPLFEAYQEQIKSTVADIKNVGDREAGTITAACFLSHFVEPKQAWAHIDIAGTAWDLTGKQSHIPKGASGVGVRLLCEFVLSSWQ